MNNTDVRVALRTALSSDPELVALLSAPTAVYHRTAPQSAREPLVIFAKSSGIEVLAFKDGGFKDQLWTVKGVCRGGDAEQAEAIDDRCAELLQNAELDISGGRTLSLFRVSDVDYGEGDKGADQIHHVGGIYRLAIEEEGS